MIPLDLDSDVPVAIVDGQRLMAKELETAADAACSAIHREDRRRGDMANREEGARAFRK